MRDPRQLTLEDLPKKQATAKNLRKEHRTKFQIAVEKVLEGHGLLGKFQTVNDFHVRLEQEPYEPLVIERHGEMISVAHYIEEDHEAIPDPDVELHFPDWSPTAIQMQNGYYTSKFVERDGRQYVNIAFDKSVRPLLTTWARNIKAQGWADPNKVKATGRSVPAQEV